MGLLHIASFAAKRDSVYLEYDDATLVVNGVRCANQSRNGAAISVTMERETNVPEEKLTHSVDAVTGSKTIVVPSETKEQKLQLIDMKDGDAKAIFGGVSVSVKWPGDGD